MTEEVRLDASSWRSYPKVYALGHRATQDILHRNLYVQEKVDGSQFSFGVFEEATDNSKMIGTRQHLRVRSRGREIPIGSGETGDKLFAMAIQTADDLACEGRLVPGWTYRGEAITSPKHNTLEYDRIPKGGIMLFDVNTGHEEYLAYDQMVEHVTRDLALEVVPLLHEGRTTLELIDELLKTDSRLGGPHIEGVVLKPVLPYYGEDKKLVIAKYVSEAFKEKHTGNPEFASKSKGSIVDRLVESLATEARWEKAVQHLREAGTLLDDPRDIGAVIAEVKRDVAEEEGEWIRERLFSEHEHAVMSGITRGLPEWYKRRLAESVR